MANEKQIKLRYVTGQGKNGRAYYAVEISLPTVTGGYRVKLCFLNDLEIQLLGLDVNSDFVNR